MDLPSTPWTIHLSQIYSLYSSSPDGLDPKTVFQNRGLFGSNHLLLQKPRTALSILVAQFENWLVIILIIAALFSYFLGEKVDSLFILGIIGMSVVLGFFQEYRAENSLDKLKNLLTHKARVKRQGVWTEINSDDLVVGDIIELRIGDRVPADIRLLETDNFAIDQSLLTGESVPVVKTEHPLSDSQLSLTEQSNLAFSSTYVTSGLATGLVISTGKNTYVGKTAIRLEQKENHTDFQTQIQKFSAFLFRTVIVLTAFVFLSNSLLGKGVFNSFFFALALAVGIAPELLPMIITVTLSQSALKMAKKQVVIKRLISVEDFGNMDTLCTDKTGTLTQGTFSLDSYVDLHNNVDDTTLIYGLVCSSGFKNSGHTTSSNQIDQALWDSPLKSSVAPHLIQYSLLDENEFDFDRKRMSVVAKQADHKLLIAKGSSESIITACSHYWNGKVTQKITQTIKKTLLQKAIDLENQGYKTISVAYKKTLHSETSLSDETQLTFRGFLLFSDPIKESAVHSLHLFQKLGVNIKVLSGDSPQVVKHIGLQTQLAQPTTNVVTGDQLIGLESRSVINTIA
jgi:Mg2+-importing ATPase